jgi:hypothetical protein
VSDDVDRRLDAALRALARAEPSPELGERVLAQLRTDVQRGPARGGRPAARPRIPAWGWALAAVVLVVGGFALLRYRHRHESRQAQASAEPSPAFSRPASVPPPMVADSAPREAASTRRAARRSTRARDTRRRAPVELPETPPPFPALQVERLQEAPALRTPELRSASLDALRPLTIEPLEMARLLPIDDEPVQERRF